MNLDILKSTIHKAVDESNDVEVLTLISKVLASDDAENCMDTLEEDFSFEEAPEFWNKINAARQSIQDGFGISHDTALKMLKDKCGIK